MNTTCSNGAAKPTGQNKDIVTIALDRTSDDLLYRQVYKRFKEAIINGNYPAGSRVPSIRTLATMLKLSRNTVEMAYDLLIGEGYFTTNGQAGTSVSYDCMRNPGNFILNPVASAKPLQPLPFQIGVPALDAFPLKIWSSLNQRQHKSSREMSMDLQNANGYGPLREAIAAYLNVSRGVNCTSAQVFITTGYRQSMQLLLAGLVKPGDEVWTEDPCYPPARRLLEQFHLHQINVPVDMEGLCVEDGIRQASHARMALVTPSNQSPLGMELSMRRKAELLAWACREQSWIIEDDHDSEFCFDGRLAPTISNLDRIGRTFYLGTFSKTVHPALRLAFVIVPAQQTETFNRIANHIMDGSPLHVQKVLADFMIEGHFAKHLKKMRSLYAKRRQWLADELEAKLGDRIRISSISRGLCLLAHLEDGSCDVDIAKLACEAGLAVDALSPRAVEHDYGQALLLGFANFTDEAATRSAVETLASCLPD